MSNGSRRGGGDRRQGTGAGAGGAVGGGQRGLFVRVKTARGRKSSSTRWLQRQLNDPYVTEARRLGYRSRAAFKLIEMDDKLAILKKGLRVVDLGAAPGGWTQVAVARVGAGESAGGGTVVGLDILEWEPVAGAACIIQDFMEDGAPEALKAALGGPADVVLSDMSPNTTGHPQTDHIRIMALVEAAYAFATEVLVEGGTFVAKVFQGGAEHQFLAQVKQDFKTVRHVKPPASRKESPETYMIASGFRGGSGE